MYTCVYITCIYKMNEITDSILQLVIQDVD